MEQANLKKKQLITTSQFLTIKNYLMVNTLKSGYQNSQNFEISGQKLSLISGYHVPNSLFPIDTLISGYNTLISRYYMPNFFVSHTYQGNCTVSLIHTLIPRYDIFQGIINRYHNFLWFSSFRGNTLMCDTLDQMI